MTLKSRKRQFNRYLSLLSHNLSFFVIFISIYVLRSHVTASAKASVTRMIYDSSEQLFQAVISLVYAWPLSCNFLQLRRSVSVTHLPKWMVHNQIPSYRPIECGYSRVKWKEKKYYMLRYVIFYVRATRSLRNHVRHFDTDAACATNPNAFDYNLQFDCVYEL